MIVTQQIKRDLHTNTGNPPMDMVQGDTARAVEVSLYAGGEVWTVPEGATVLIRYRKGDGTGGVYDTLPDGTQAWSVSGNTVTVALAPQVLAAAGVAVMQVSIAVEEEILSTFDILLRVQPDPSAGVVESGDYYNLRQWVAEAVSELGSSFCVSVTQPGTASPIADKTFAEIMAAYGTGKTVYCLVGHEYVLPLAMVSGDGSTVIFQGVNKRYYQRVVISSDDTLTYTSGNYALRDDLPTALPNPSKLILTGAVAAEYDGSGEVAVEIPAGEDGATFTPSVSADGVLSWSNDRGLENPESVDLVQKVIDAIGTPVFGTVDSDNVITLSGALDEGTYTLKYEDSAGSTTEIGSLTLGSGGEAQ